MIIGEQNGNCICIIKLYMLVNRVLPTITNSYAGGTTWMIGSVHSFAEYTLLANCIVVNMK
jgi:hypothetical protein